MFVGTENSRDSGSFIFKFQRWQPKKTLAYEHSKDTHNRFHRFEPQVNYNSEENFTVLQVTIHFIIPPK